MGRWATYVIGPEREDPPAAYARHGKTTPGWFWWELPLSESGPSEPGHTVVAKILDSDVADIRGLVAGELNWRWVYGEATLAEYEERPVDTHALEKSLPRRAEEASRQIVAWAADAGLPPADGQGLAEVLQRNHTFAEKGVFEVLEALHIVAADSPVECQDLEPAD
ncbi:hypothetical protein ACWGID_30890 [Kribbella sp. NPDC054772]